MREDLQQDKRSALLAVVKMFEDFQVPYVVTGGLAVQLYSSEPRHTNDVDLVSLRAAFKSIQAAQPWPQYGFELVFDRRRYIKLRHVSSNTDIDINVDTRFARLLEDPSYEFLDGQRIAFTSRLQISFAKLRTQRADWPRDPAKRYQDRGDLIRMFREYPDVPAALKGDPMLTDEMREILGQVIAEAGAGADDLPDDDVPA